MTLISNRSQMKMASSKFQPPFFPTPVLTGCYGCLESEQHILVSNNVKDLTLVQDRLDQYAVCVFDSGGFSVREAVSFQSFDINDIHRILSRSKGSLNNVIGDILLVPASICQRLHWNDGDNFEGYKITLCKDDFSPIRSILDKPTKSLSFLSRLLIRLVGGMRLIVGQLLVFSIPAAIISLDVLLFLVLIMLLIGLAQILFWEILPGKGWLRGLLAGVILNTIWGALALICSITAPITIVLVSLICLLLSVWFGFVFSGVSAK